MLDATERNDILERFKQHLDTATEAHKEFRESAAYKKWERALAKDVEIICKSAQRFDTEEILRTEIACIEQDIAMHQRSENEFGLRFAKHNMFQCICALNYVQNINASPQQYRDIAEKCSFDAYIRIPRFDPFISACLHVYKGLYGILVAGPASLYNFSPYYKARVQNLRIAMRAHRRWQKKVLRGEE